MGFSNRESQSQDRGTTVRPTQAVTVHFDSGSPYRTRLFELEDKVEHAITTSRTGKLDGHEFAADGSKGRLFMYGPNAEALFSAIRPTLETFDFMKGARAVLESASSDGEVNRVELILGS
ncbi:MAG: hypothetical protein P8Y44_05785 [Acidobacteriota bacterium]